MHASTEMGAFIPYPAIERHGVIGDRRTAALISSDGTLDWMCWPDYDGQVVFGALLDSNRGGFWRVGPATLWAGQQAYTGAAPILRTCWKTPNYELELVDAMAWPADDGGADVQDRAVLRRLTCCRGAIGCVSEYVPALDFAPVKAPKLSSGATWLQWSSDVGLRGRSGSLRLHAGDVVWFVLSTRRGESWSSDEAERLLAEVDRYWAAALDAFGGRRLNARLVRSAVTIRLLEYAPAGSIVAAPTTSLPERIGGGWNADYRLTWVRDASLSIATLARLGDVASARRYFDWLTSLGSTTDAPLQVAYKIAGGLEPRQHERDDLEGYRGSKPVRFGNHAYRQHQHDKSGYLADCVWTYLQHDGEWDGSWWDLLERVGDFTCDHWHDLGHGIWELPARERYVSSHVMAWAALDRLLKIADRVDRRPARADQWRVARADIRREVETNGWSEALGAFTQAVGVEALDASALLIPIVGFLPPSDPRVIATIDRIAEHLTIDGCVYRFDPRRVPQAGPSAMGEYEAAFLPCTFWLATAFAMIGRRRDAEDILYGVERVAGRVGLFAEGLDPRTSAFLGNTPLLFSHVEYIRAVMAVDSTDDPASSTSGSAGRRRLAVANDI